MNLPFFTKLLKTKWLYLLFIDITIVIVIFHNNELLNNYLATRPSLFYLYLDQYTIYTLFGKCYVGMMNYPLDNGFLFTLFDGGIIALILICYTFYISFKNNEDTKIKIVLIAVLIYSLFECLSTIYANPIYILMFSELLEIYYKNKDKIKIIEDNKEKESIKKAKQKI
jgi:hypothetical protein